MIRFTCPQCQQPLQHPNAHEKVTCPKCRQHVRVPTPTLQSTPYNPPPPPPNRHLHRVPEPAAPCGLPFAVPPLGNVQERAALVPQIADQPNGPQNGQDFWGWLGRHLIATFLSVLSAVLATLAGIACLYYFTPLGDRMGSVIDLVNSRNPPGNTDQLVSGKKVADQPRSEKKGQNQPKDGAKAADQPKGLQKPAPNPSLEFDSTNPQKTLAWLTALSEEYRTSQNNELAKERGKEKFAAGLKGLVGQKVRWAFRVSTVGKGSDNAFITFQPLMRNNRMETDKQGRPLPAIYIFNKQLPGQVSVPQQNWMADLKQDDSVIVSGIIERAYIHENIAFSPDGAAFQLKDVSVEPGQ
jgi:hypothetical protein